MSVNLGCCEGQFILQRTVNILVAERVGLNKVFGQFTLLLYPLDKALVAFLALECIFELIPQLRDHSLPIHVPFLNLRHPLIHLKLLGEYLIVLLLQVFIQLPQIVILESDILRRFFVLGAPLFNDLRGHDPLMV